MIIKSNSRKFFHYKYSRFKRIESIKIIYQNVFFFYHLIIQLDQIHHPDESERFSPCQRGNELKGRGGDDRVFRRQCKEKARLAVSRAFPAHASSDTVLRA